VTHSLCHQTNQTAKFNLYYCAVYFCKMNNWYTNTTLMPSNVSGDDLQSVSAH